MVKQNAGGPEVGADVQRLTSALETMLRLQSKPQALLDLLNGLGSFGPLSTKVLHDTGVGIIVNKMRKNSEIAPAVRAAAWDLVDQWKSGVHQQRQRGRQSKSQPSTSKNSERRSGQGQTKKSISEVGSAADEHAKKHKTEQSASSTAPAKTVERHKTKTSENHKTSEKFVNVSAALPAGSILQESTKVNGHSTAPPAPVNRSSAHDVLGAESSKSVCVSAEYAHGEQLFAAWIISKTGKRMIGPGRKTWDRAMADGELLEALILNCPASDKITRGWRAGDLGDADVRRRLKELATSGPGFQSQAQKKENAKEKAKAKAQAEAKAKAKAKPKAKSKAKPKVKPKSKKKI